VLGVQVIGEPFYEQNYGIAIQRNLANGAFQRAISEELLVLRESGVIDRLEQTWFPPVCNDTLGQWIEYAKAATN
jgi:ABC-type amino acid transport substrate-binding protein